MIAISQAGVFARLQPFASWHTPIAWTGFILFADAWIWNRRGESPLQSDRAEITFMALASVPLWVVFEIANRVWLHNWHYIGLPDVLLLRYAGYTWAFATITPAILIGAELAGAIHDRRAPAYRRQDPLQVPLGAGGWASVVAGALMLAAPIVSPSPWMPALAWLGLILLLDPVNARNGAESIRGDLRSGHAQRLINLLMAGVMCGLLWELWNARTLTKLVSAAPLALYLGYPVFAVQAFVSYIFVRQLLWRGSWRPTAL